MVTLQDGGIIKVLTSVNSTQDAKERETTFILRMPVADNVYRNTVSSLLFLSINKIHPNGIELLVWYEITVDTVMYIHDK